MHLRVTSAGDPSHGYDAAAAEFVRRRSRSDIGVATVRAWARWLPRGGAVLDLGCGPGVPLAAVLVDDGFAVHGVDASPAGTYRGEGDNHYFSAVRS